MANKEKLVKEILSCLDSNPAEGMSAHEMLSYLGNVDTAYFRHVLSMLLSSGKIIRKARGRYAPAESSSSFTGVFKGNPKGFGFITQDSGQPAIFVSPLFSIDAITGDIRPFPAGTDADPT